MPTKIPLPHLAILAIGLSATPHVCAQQPIDPAEARRAFDQAKTLSDHDNGALWGTALYGPMLFVDPATRTVITNAADGEGALTPADHDTFIGTLPDTIGIANTTIRFAGVQWAMVIWPLPAHTEERGSLMMHECFHRIQRDIGLPMSLRNNAHLDTAPGRIWLRLEWLALADALSADDPLESDAVRDALLFRAQRKAITRNAVEEERIVELNEGLAEYTGVRLGGYTAEEARQRTVRQLIAYERMTSFSGSFAYATGPAYGLLLDLAKPGWPRSVDLQSDLAAMLASLVHFRPPDDLAEKARARADLYDGQRIIAAETDAEDSRAQRAAALRAMFIESAVLRLPMTGDANFTFNPHGAQTLEGFGKVYPSMRISAAWGILDSSGPVLWVTEVEGSQHFRVPAPAEVSRDDADAAEIEAAGYTLTLNPGWRVRKINLKGDYVVEETRGR